jgi:hypothetical protein
MKIFISWSGQTSKNIAEILRQWFPSVIQVVKPYYSPDDITKGTRWGSEISKELDESRIGIICLTKDNLNSPWIMFEAGALSKNIDKSKVCPILFGIEPTDIQGPLVQFQAAKFSKDEMKKVAKMINIELGEHALTSEVFENVYEMWWPKLNEKIEDEISKASKSVNKDVREERDILEEILSLTRNISLSREKMIERDGFIEPDVIQDMIYSWSLIVQGLAKDDKDEIYESLKKIHRPLRYIVERADVSRVMRRDFLNTIEMGISRLEDYRGTSLFENIKADKMEGPKILGKIELPINQDILSKPRRRM